MNDDTSTHLGLISSSQRVAEDVVDHLATSVCEDGEEGVGELQIH